MIAGVKKCIDAGDIMGLRYIFLDSLDVDPTFEKYKDDYAVCKSLDGMFETYTELTPLSPSHSDWNMEYWVKIKFDQKKNFSEKRFEHMIEIAKVVHAEKIERLLAERAEKQAKIEEQINQVIPKAGSQLMSQSNVEQPIQGKPINIISGSNRNEISEGSISDSDKARLNGDKRDIDLHNQRIEKEELEKKNQREARAKEIEKQNALLEEQNRSKKVPGIVATIIVIIFIVVVVLLLKVL